MIRNKKITVCILLLLVCILAMAPMCFVNAREVKAEEVFKVTPGCFDKYTDDERLYDEATGTNLPQTVDQYVSYFNEHYASFLNVPEKEWQESMRNGYVEDEWILKIVPKELFQNEGRYFYIGKKYGFFVETIGDSVFVYLMLVDAKVFETVGVVDIKIMPHFNYTFRYDENLNKAYAIPTFVFHDYQYSKNYVVKYELDKTRYTSLSDISFSGAVYNKHHLNQGQAGYNAAEDKGLFIYGTNYQYNGIACKAQSSKVYDKAAVDLLINFIPGAEVLGSLGKMIGYAKDAYAVYNYVDTVTSEQVKRQTGVRSSESVYLELTHNTREAQLEAFGGKLQKDGFAACKTSNDDPALFTFLKDHYAKATFLIGGENKIETRFSGTVSMKMFREQPTVGDKTLELLYDDVTSTPFFFDIYDGDEDAAAMTVGDEKDIHILQSDEKDITLNTVYAGNYKIYSDIPKDIYLKLYDINGVLIKESNTNILDVELKSNTKYTLKTGLKNPEEIGSYKLKFGVKQIAIQTPSSFLIGAQVNEGVIVGSFAADKTSIYTIASGNPNINISIVDEHMNMVNGAFAPNITEKFVEGKTYFVLAKRISGAAGQLSGQIYVDMAKAIELKQNYTKNLTVTHNNDGLIFSSSSDKIVTVTLRSSRGLIYDLFENDSKNVVKHEYTTTGNNIIINLRITKNIEYCFLVRLNSAEAVSSASVPLNIAVFDSTYCWQDQLNQEYSDNQVYVKKGTSCFVYLTINNIIVNDVICTNKSGGVNNQYISYSSTENKIMIDKSFFLNDADTQYYTLSFKLSSESSLEYLLYIVVQNDYDFNYSILNNEEALGLNYSLSNTVTFNKVIFNYEVKGYNINKNQSTESTKSQDSLIVLNSITIKQYKSLTYINVNILSVVFYVNIPTGGEVTYTMYNKAYYPSKLQAYEFPKFELDGLYGGKTADVIKITCERHLLNIEFNNRYISPIGYLVYGDYKLMNNINLSKSGVIIKYNFNGTFNGNYKTISGLKVNSSSSGLEFGMFANNNGTISNLYLDEVNIQYNGTSGNALIGCIAAFNGGRIANCSVLGGTINVKYNAVSAGGIAGKNVGTIKSCTNYASIYGYCDIGGVAGMNSGTIDSCNNYGDLEWLYKGANRSIGGIVGYNESSGKVIGCTSSCTIRWNETDKNRAILPNMGHIVGHNAGSQTNNSDYSGHSINYFYSTFFISPYDQSGHCFKVDGGKVGYGNA